MENKKLSISLSTLLIIIIVIFTIFGLVISFIYNNLNKKNSNSSFINEIANNSKNETLSENTDKVTEEINNNQASTNASTSSNNTDNSSTSTNNTNNSSSVPSSITGKASSKSSPLEINEWGLASIRIFSGEYVDVPVRVTNVTRGTTAVQKVKEYCNRPSSIYKYSDPEENMEWSVIEYQVDLTKIENTVINMETSITGTDTPSVKYNGYSYYIWVNNMSPEYIEGEIVTCQFAVQLPIGCTDYLIELGSDYNDRTVAYIKGQ